MFATAAALVPAAYVAPYAGRLLAERRLRRRCAQTRTLVLTYDDGPSPETTPRLLELLGERDVRATFFMLGRNVSQHPYLVDQVLDAGHEVGCHSQGHVNAWKSAPWRAQADMQAGYATLERWIGPAAPYRPPHGKLDGLTWLQLRRRGAPKAWWTIDAGDTFTPLPEPGHPAETVRRSGGGIVLLHDVERSADRNDFVLEATRRLLDVADEDGLRVAPLGELLGRGG